MAEADAEINIDDDGSVHIYSNNGESLKRSRHDHIFQQLKKSVVSRNNSGTVFVTAGLTPFGMVFPIESARERATMPSVLLASSVFSRVISRASMLTVNTSIAIGIPRTKAECRRGVHLDHLSKGSHKSISNPGQVLPVAKFSLKAHAFGDLEA